jgi:hypothetical protein
MRFDSRTRKIIEQRRTSIESAKSLTEITLTLLNTPWKVEPPGGNTVDSEKEKQAVFRSARGKERWSNNESVNEHIQITIVQRQSMI